MTPTIVKAADAAQFLAFVPRMLGYRPRSSLVVVPFHGGRSLGAMRFDLPPEDADDETVDRIAATVIGMACRLPAADAVAAIAYTDTLFEDGGRMPRRALLDALERRADSCGLRVTDLLCVAADGWGSSLDADCPASGRSLDALEQRMPAFDDVPEPDGDQSTGAELPACAAEERERVGRAYEAVEQAVALLCGPEDPVAGSATRTVRSAGAACSGGPSADLAPVPPPVAGDAEDEASVADSPGRFDPRALATVCRLDDLPGFFEDAISRSPAPRDPYDMAALVWCLARPSLRDVALVQWSGDLAQGDEALDAQLRWESGEEYPADLAMRMWGEGDVPDSARLVRALALVRHAAAAAPRVAQPGPLSLCAWLAWALGQSTHAAAYAERACEIEPEHGLSQIVLSFVQAGHLPDWAFRRARAR